MTLFFLSMNTVSANGISNGIYLQSQDTKCPLLKNQTGKNIFIGEKKEPKILKIKNISENNANTGFNFTLLTPYDTTTCYVLVVNQNAYTSDAWGSEKNETSSIHFRVLGEKNIQEVAKYLNVSLNYRSHPKHNLFLTFVPTKKEFIIGEEVFVTMQIKNVGNNIISFDKGGRNRGMRDNQYIFNGRYRGEQIKDIGSIFHHGGLSFKKVLKPGDILEETISLNKWFAFEKSGNYEIFGSFYLNFRDDTNDSGGSIWEDYVSENFNVKIIEISKSSIINEF